MFGHHTSLGLVRPDTAGRNVNHFLDKFQQVTGLSKLLSKADVGLYLSSDFVRIIKYKRIRWVEYVAPLI